MYQEESALVATMGILLKTHKYDALDNFYRAAILLYPKSKAIMQLQMEMYFASTRNFYRKDCKEDCLQALNAFPEELAFSIAYICYAEYRGTREEKSKGYSLIKTLDFSTVPVEEAVKYCIAFFQVTKYSLELVNKALEAYPENEKLLSLKAQILFANCNEDGKKQAVEIWTNLEQKTGKRYLQKVEALVDLARYREAATYLVAYFEKNPNDYAGVHSAYDTLITSWGVVLVQNEMLEISSAFVADFG